MNGDSNGNGHGNGYENHAGPSRGRSHSLAHGHHPLSAPPTTTSFGYLDEEDEQTLDVIPSRAGRKLCVRHKQMANQNVNAKLQKSLDNLPTTERQDVTHLWATFSNAPHAKRKLILEGILTMCCFSQLSHLSDQLNEIIRIDPFSLLPREVNLRILGYLDAISLGRAAQVSKGWKALADDDLLWRRMCGQHIDRKCEKCGWGLPLLERRRLKVELKDFSPNAAVGIGHHDHDHDHEDGHDHLGSHGHGHHHGSHEVSQLMTRTEALGEMDKGKATAYKTCDTAAQSSSAGNGNGTGNTLKRSASAVTSPENSKRLRKEDIMSDSDEEKKLVTLTAPGGGTLTREVRLTRPWKTVYCERLLVERNWRKGRFTSKTLKGHTNGVMCLQYHTALTNPSYPVLITGSYDRTVRVWNLDTGTEVRTLRGHTRAVRALQFDQMLLFTGAMDGTVRMWNWRAGECLRVLEGHTDGVICLNYNGYLLASGSADSTIQVWNFRTGTKFVLRGHTEWVNSVVLWDGKTSPSEMDPTAIPSFTKSMGKGRSTSPHQLQSTTTNSASSGISGDADKPDIEPGTMLFSSSDDMTIKLWDLNTQSCIRTFEGHKAHVQSIKILMVDMSEEEIRRAQYRSSRTFSPVNSTSTSTSNAVSAFQPASRSPPASVASLHAGAISPHIASAPPGYDPLSFRLRSRTEQVEPKSFLHTDIPEGDEKEKDGGDRQKKAMLISGALDGTIKLWDVETGIEKSTLFGHIEGVWGVDIDALRIASASHDRTVKVWDSESGNCVQTLVGHRGAVTSLQLSDDMIISGSDDGDVMVWNFAPPASVLANLPKSPAPLLR